ncbi:branched-chain amino acid ABC transporter permease [Terasakiella pusilla]|uniref:branched-chain amino acid ABC transporter permease n=1 Tax=Terasakiella pusilla TaxID=64973 RepID=UPI003AA99983
MRVRIVQLSTLLILFTLPFIAQWAGQPFWIDLTTRIVIYGIAAMSLDIILGYGGMVSLGHAMFLGIGAYSMGILTHHSFEGSVVPFLPGEWTGSTSGFVHLAASILASGLLGLVIGLLSLRTVGVYFIMITLAFAQMMFYFFIALPTYGGEDGLNVWSRSEIPGLDLSDSMTFYFVCLSLLCAFWFIARRLVDSRFGGVLRGCKQNEQRLKALGYNTIRYKLIAFTIAGAGAGLAGGLLANLTEFVGPGTMHWTKSGELIVMVLLGGMGTLIGPVLGSAALLLLEEILSGFTEHWMIVLGPILLLVVLFARRGIYGFLAGKEAKDG